MFGHRQWRDQRFMSLRGRQREGEFIDYFVQEVGAKYHVRVPLPYSPEDRVRGKQRRRKFYLLHFSNHPKAALLMKDVLWAAREDIEKLQFGVPGEAEQLKLFDTEPSMDQRSQDLLSRFRGRTITFDGIRVETLDWQIAEKHYRAILKVLEDSGAVSVKRIESKKSGLKGRDLVQFP